MSSEYLAETNDPGLDQRVSIAFIAIDTFYSAGVLREPVLQP